MGAGSSKKTESVVADSVDISNNLSKDFTILRIHGDTGALIAGSVATLLLIYVIYRGILWKRAKMGAGRREPQDGQRAVWGNPEGSPWRAGQDLREWRGGLHLCTRPIRRSTSSSGTAL